MSIAYRPFSEQARRDPYSLYRALRRESPVHRVDDPAVWAVSRYEDVLYVLKHTELFSSDAMSSVMMGVDPRAIADPTIDPRAMENLLAFAQAMPFEIESLARARNLIMSDPPAHDLLRKIVNRGFTPRRIAAWEQRVRELVEACMARLRGGQSFDLIGDLAVPVPVAIIAEMLGVAADRKSDFKRWSDGIIAGISGSGRDRGFLRSGVVEIVAEFAAYFEAVAAQRRAEPRDDLVSLLLQAEDGEAGLQAHELVIFILILLIAGNETTTNLIGNTVKALLENPEQLDLVRRDRRLIPALVEEGLRYDSPIQFLFRRARRDTEIAGRPIREHEIVMPILGSANRDERHWKDADRFDVTRDALGHVAFGFGAHFCLGAALARLEARCALEALLDVLPGLCCDVEGIEHVDSTLVRGFKRIELRLAA